MHLSDHSLLFYQVLSALMDFLSQLRSHKITFRIELFNKRFKSIGFFKNLLKNLAKLFNFLDGKSLASILQNFLDLGNKILGSLKFVKDIEAFGGHFIDGLANFIHNFFT